MEEKHLNRLALQQYHEDVEKQGEMMLKLTKAMEALNSKEININLPDNLRIKGQPITQITGDVKAIVANAISIDNLDDLAKHLEAIVEAVKANKPKTEKQGPAEVKGITELIDIVKELAAKDFGITKVKDQVVVFPKQARDAMPVRLVLAQQDKFYNASFQGGNYSAPDNIGVFNAEQERINPATEEGLQQIVSALGVLNGDQDEDDQIDILNQMASALQAIASARGIAADLRVTILGGSVATLTNMAQMGGQPLQPYVPAQLNLAAIQSNISNVVVS